LRSTRLRELADLEERLTALEQRMEDKEAA
jgi:hypothetical protein